MKRFFNIINSSVQFGASLAGCVSFVGLVYAFIFPAKAAQKWVDIQSAYEQVRQDMQSMTNDLSAISQTSSGIEMNTGAIADAVKDKLDWKLIYNSGSNGSGLKLQNATNYPAKVVIVVEGLQSKIWENETREKLLEFEAIIPASEYKSFWLSETSGQSRWDFPSSFPYYAEDAYYKAAKYSTTICVHTEFLSGDMPKRIETRTYVDKQNLVNYDIFEGNASDCR